MASAPATIQCIHIAFRERPAAHRSGVPDLGGQRPHPGRHNGGIRHGILLTALTAVRSPYHALAVSTSHSGVVRPKACGCLLETVTGASV